MDTPLLDNIHGIRRHVKSEYVYALLFSGRVMYVGRTSSVDRRANEHRLRGVEFDDVWFVTVEPGHAPAVESALIRLLRPPQNRAIPPMPVGDDFAEILDSYGIALPEYDIEYVEESTLQDFITLRETLGLSRREVSLSFGYPENYIWRVENGRATYRHVLYLALLGLQRS